MPETTATRRHKALFTSSNIIINVVLLCLLCLQWFMIGHHSYKGHDVIHTRKTATVYINKYLKKNRTQKFYIVPTGVFVKSLFFETNQIVNATGYIWQFFPKSLPRRIARNYFIPDKVETRNTYAQKLLLDRKTRAGELKLWLFEAHLIEKFGYTDYPLDHKTVTIRVFPRSFADNVILVPYFTSYDKNTKHSLFGVDSEIVPNGFNYNNSFFSYNIKYYNVGLLTHRHHSFMSIPELHFNVILQRIFIDAFFIHLLPIFTLLTLLYLTIMNITWDKKKMTLLNLNLSGVLAACSALFLVLVLSHVSLRYSFENVQGLMYIEYFYIIAYFAILFATVNTFLFYRSAEDSWIRKYICFKDNILIKVLYWPVLLTVLNIVTYFRFKL